MVLAFSLTVTVITVPDTEILVSSLSGFASTATLHIPSKLKLIVALGIAGFMIVTSGSLGSLDSVCRAVEINKLCHILMTHTSMSTGNIGLVARKPVLGGLRTTKGRPACASAQSDQRLC